MLSMVFLNTSIFDNPVSVNNFLISLIEEFASTAIISVLGSITSLVFKSEKSSAFLKISISVSTFSLS